MIAPTTTRIGDVPVRIHAPPTSAALPPAVIFFHGLRSEGAANYREGDAIAAGGMTAVLPDAPHHGARRSELLDTMPDTETREGYRRLLAILREARDEVPALVDRLLAAGHPRVAIGGVSMGAYVALAAGAIEPRLAAVASILGSPDWTPREGGWDEIGAALEESPHRRPEAYAPRPLLLLNGGQDLSVPPEGARALVARLRPLYAAPGTGPLVHREYPDVPHAVPEPVWTEMVDITVNFLAGALLEKK